MALLFMDSFDHYVTADLAERYAVNSSALATPSINATSGRRGSSSFRLVISAGVSSNAQVGISKIYTPDTTCIIGVSYVISTSSMINTNGISLMSIRDGGTSQITLALNNALGLSVRRGSHSGTVLGTASSALSSGISVYIELKVLIHPSAGTVDLRINGASVLSLTGQNTRNTANTSWTGVTLGTIDSVGFSWINSGTMDYDDLYVCDGSGSAPWNTFLGDCRVDPCYPTAEGTTIQWTPSSGTDNALMVDETAPNDDTDYNSAASTGLTDTFVTQDAPVVGATIYGIQHNLSMKKSDAGVCTIAPVIRHSGVDNVGSSLSPGTSYAYGLAVNQINPGTSAAWAESDFNAAEFGYKRVT